MTSPNGKLTSAQTKAQAKAVMALIPEDLPESVLASVKRQISQRLNILRSENIKTAPRRSVTLDEFDEIMSTFCIKYERPVHLTPANLVQANRVLESIGLDRAKAIDYARWCASQEWFMQDACQRRALNSMGGNLLTALRYGEYVRSMETDESAET